jgi:hypothetical protein
LPPENDVSGLGFEEALATYLARLNGKTIGKGELLEVTGVDESMLDRALLSLITARKVVQRKMRDGAGYATLDLDNAEPRSSTFQPSLFSQE